MIAFVLIILLNTSDGRDIKYYPEPFATLDECHAMAKKVDFKNTFDYQCGMLFLKDFDLKGKE